MVKRKCGSWTTKQSEPSEEVCKEEGKWTEEARVHEETEGMRSTITVDLSVLKHYLGFSFVF